VVFGLSNGRDEAASGKELARWRSSLIAQRAAVSPAGDEFAIGVAEGEVAEFLGAGRAPRCARRRGG
jgi:hypothetical protein